MNNILALTETLDTIIDETDGKEVSANDLVEALNSRGYGPLLIVPAIITILPTGAIPGVPDICAVLIILISIQMMLGRNHPWIPKKLAAYTISRETLVNSINSAKPYTQKIDQYIHPRLKFLTDKAVMPFLAFICIMLSFAIMILGFIPFMAALPASGILLIGLGLSGKDGLMLLLSIALMIISFIAIPLLGLWLI